MKRSTLLFLVSLVASGLGIFLLWGLWEILAGVFFLLWGNNLMEAGNKTLKKEKFHRFTKKWRTPSA